MKLRSEKLPLCFTLQSKDICYILSGANMTKRNSICEQKCDFNQSRQEGQYFQSRVLSQFLFVKQETAEGSELITNESESDSLDNFGLVLCYSESSKDHYFTDKIIRKLCLRSTVLTFYILQIKLDDSSSFPPKL